MPKPNHALPRRATGFPARPCNHCVSQRPRAAKVTQNPLSARRTSSRRMAGVHHSSGPRARSRAPPLRHVRSRFESRGPCRLRAFRRPCRSRSRVGGQTDLDVPPQFLPVRVREARVEGEAFDEHPAPFSGKGAALSFSLRCLFQIVADQGAPGIWPGRASPSARVAVTGFALPRGI